MENICTITKKDILKLAVAIAVSQLAGIVGSFFTAPAIPGWYAALVKPALNPPSWVFGPIWIVLFTLIGTAAFLIWQKGLERRDVKIALGIFTGQLVLNVAWSVIFFGLRSPGAAFVEIVLLWLAILATLVSFSKISRPAAWLILPYALWVAFAGYLNFSIWQMQSSSPRATLVATDYKSIAYEIEGKKVKLNDGYSEEKPVSGAISKVITRYFGNEARGDLNGDGKEDIAFILTQDGGGSGIFYYIAAALRTDAGFNGTNAIFLGDRISPQSTEFREGWVIVNYAERRPNQPMTESPSVGVSRYFTANGGKLAETNNEKHDLIVVSDPAPLSVIVSPLTVRGMARGYWFFEASFPLALVDWDGRIIAEGYATAKEDWMTENFVQFEGKLDFTKPEIFADFTKRGALIFRKDNPSGLPEHDDALEIPIFFE